MFSSFSNVSSQMNSWLGTVGDMIGMKEGEKAEKEEGKEPKEEGGEKGSPSGDEKSEGIDEVKPSNETKGSIHIPKIDPAHLQEVAVEGAKNLGNLLSTAFNIAGKHVAEAGVILKETVEKAPMLGDFNKKQDEFIKEKHAHSGGPVPPPWVGYGESEEDVKLKIISLSSDRRNFVRSPPSGVDFQFNLDAMLPVAASILKVDPDLEKMRYELVPKVVKEHEFWRNYFYRVNLICQSSDLSTIAARQGLIESVADTSRTPVAASAKKEDDDVAVDSTSPTAVEFASDDFASPSSEDAKIPRASSADADKDWEKELEDELQGYEVVTENKLGADDTLDDDDAMDDRDLEIEKMLEEESGLK